MGSSVTHLLRATAISLAIAVASGQTPTLINPCPQDRTVEPLTVTSQYQAVSTCYPTTSCFFNGTCAQTYAYSTYRYVSTVIPCAVSNGAASTCTVTSTQDIVVLSTAKTTVTSVRPVVTAFGRHGRPNRRPSFTTIYESRDRRVEAEYDEMGPLAVEGYEGSGLCQTCSSPDGSLEQQVNIVECRKRSDQSQSVCKREQEVWLSLPAPPPVETTAVCATRFAAPSAGTYTFVFEREAPAQTLTAPARTVTVSLPDGRPTQHVWPGSTYTITEQLWYATVTEVCNGPTVIDFTTTITTTITMNCPIVTVTATDTSTISVSAPSTTGMSTSISSTSSLITPTVNPTLMSTLSSTTSSSSSSSVSTSAVTSAITSSNTASSVGTTISASPIFTSTTSTSTSFTSTSTTSTTSAVVTFSDPFVIRAEDVGVSVRKRAIRYVSFNGDTAVVGDQNSVLLTQFQLASNGSLYTYGDHQYVGTADNIGKVAIRKSAGNPPGAQLWTRDAINRLRLLESLQFCVDFSNILRATFPGPTSALFCLEVNCYAEFGPVPVRSSTTSSSSTTSTVSPSSSSSTSTTTSSTIISASPVSTTQGSTTATSTSMLTTTSSSDVSTTKTASSTTGTTSDSTLTTTTSPGTSTTTMMSAAVSTSSSTGTITTESTIATVTISSSVTSSTTAITDSATIATTTTSSTSTSAIVISGTSLNPTTSTTSTTVLTTTPSTATTSITTTTSSMTSLAVSDTLTSTSSTSTTTFMTTTTSTTTTDVLTTTMTAATTTSSETTTTTTPETTTTTDTTSITSTTSTTADTTTTIAGTTTATTTTDATTSTAAAVTTSDITTTTTTTTDVTTTTTTSDITTTTTTSDITTTTTTSDITTTTTTSDITTTTTTDVTTTTTSDVITTTTTADATTTTTTTSVSGPCATITGAYVIFGSGTGDFAIDGNYAQLQSAFGSGYTVQITANPGSAQQFRIQPDCSLTTADGNDLAMIGSSANLHTVYFFASIPAAQATVNTNWEALVCSENADNTLACTAMEQSVFQITPGQTTLEIGDQNYGEQVTLNLVPVPGSS